MTLYLDTADTAEWANLMPTGLFRGITTNPLLAARSGLDYPTIDWRTLAGQACDLGAKELYTQVYGPTESYVDWAGNMYEIGKATGIEIIIKIPLVEAAIRATPALKSLGGRILMTACYDAKQMFIAKALKADFIAPYYGRMLETGIDAPAHLSAMADMNNDKGHKCKIMVASIRSSEQMMQLAGLKRSVFTISPAIAQNLLLSEHSEKAFEDFETTIKHL